MDDEVEQNWQPSARDQKDYEQVDRIVKWHLTQIMEHVDTCVIVTTQHRNGSTAQWHHAAGHWHARVMSVEEYVIRQKQQILTRPK